MPVLATAPAVTERQAGGRTAPNAAPAQRNTEIIVPPATDSKVVASPNADVYGARNTQRYIPPPPPSRAPQVRRYDARDEYGPTPPPRNSSGYSNRYGERDPYYRNAYDRWYEYYYYRRR